MLGYRTATVRLVLEQALPLSLSLVFSLCLGIFTRGSAVVSIISLVVAPQISHHQRRSNGLGVPSASKCSRYSVPSRCTHRIGEYRAHGEIIYDGKFCNGAMHGQGRLLLDNGDIWAGQFWKVKLLAG